MKKTRLSPKVRREIANIVGDDQTRAFLLGLASTAGDAYKTLLTSGMGEQNAMLITAEMVAAVLDGTYRTVVEEETEEDNE